MLTTQVSAEEKRRMQRISMQLPIKIEVRVDQKKEWEEITRIKDISTFGTGFVLSRPVKRGRLIYMTIPMPRKLRNYDLSESQYKIWGIVRRCITIKEAISNAEKYSLESDLSAKNRRKVTGKIPRRFMIFPTAKRMNFGQ